MHKSNFYYSKAKKLAPYFNHVTEFKEAFPKIHDYLYRRGLLFIVADVCAFNWDFDSVCIEAKKYRTRKQFGLKSQGAYRWALDSGVMNLVCAHMKPKWTRLLLIETAKKFNARTEWAEKETGSYRCATRRGLLEVCCKHMKKA